MNANNLWLVLFLAAAVFNSVAVYRGWRRVEWLTKPAVLVILIIWFTLSTGWQGHLFWFGMALVFSLAGDVLLLRPTFFLAGLVAFLLAHVFYIIGLNPVSIPVAPFSIAATIGAWALAVFQNRRLSAVVKQKEETALLQYPIFLYILAICIMLLSTLATFVRPEWPFTAALLVACGGALFTLSDSLLAENSFVRPLPHATFYVHLTYHLAQLAIVAGVLLRYGRL